MRMKIFFYLYINLFFFTTCTVYAQAYFRVSADFSIKEKNPAGSEFYKGKVFYDRKFDKIIYEVSFPEPKKLVLADTQMYVLENQKVVKQQFTPNTNRFTIFSLALSGDLKNFGLNQSGYYINSIEEAADQTIVEWLPPPGMEEMMGKAILSLKEGQLFGIALFKPDGELMGKQFFKNYQSFQGLPFPTEVVQVTYLHGEEYYKITTFKNVKIDELENEEKYRVELFD